MYYIHIFNDKKFGEFRVVYRNKGIWFVVDDVCRILNHENEFQINPVYTEMIKIDNDGNMERIISDAYLFHLISQIKTAISQEFKRWIVVDVVDRIVSTCMVYINNYFHTRIVFDDSDRDLYNIGLNRLIMITREDTNEN